MLLLCSAVQGLVAQSCPTLCDPMDLSLSAPLSMGEYGSGLLGPPPGNFPKPGIESRCPALQTDSLLSEPPGKSMNTGVGSLSLLQGIFQTQELSQGLLHYRWSLYQLSSQERLHFSLLSILIRRSILHNILNFIG